MKTCLRLKPASQRTRSLTLMALGCLSLAPLRHAAAEVITWTNAGSGNWNIATHWSPNQVPSTNDLVVITNAGTYTVTLNVAPTIAGLIVGGEAGTQTVATAGRVLTLNGNGLVGTNGRLLLSGGAISGTSQLHLTGSMAWQYGAIDTNASLVVASVATVTIASGGSHAKLLYGNLTNEGVITWQPVGGLSIGGTLHNRAGGWFEAQTDASITKSSSNAVIVNDGVLCKSTDSGNLNCYVPLHNGGTVDTQTGQLTLRDGSVLHSGCIITGAGETWLNAGTHTLDGWIVATNLLLTGGTLEGHGTLSGACRWSSGQISPTASLTVATNGTLLLASGAQYSKSVYGNLTNAGTIIWQPLGGVSIGGTLHNLPGSFFDVQVDNNSILESGADALIVNAGLFRKSAGRYTVSCDVPFLNRGTVEILPGTLRFNGGCTNSGGTISLAGGTFRPPQPFLLADGLLTGWGSVIANLANAATVRPARTNGGLAIQGDYEQMLAGVVEFELGGNLPGTNQSRLAVTGDARLSGMLGVQWADGYVPAPSTEFTLLTFASASGKFAAFNGCYLLGQNQRLVPAYRPTTVALTTLAAPDPTTVPLSVTVQDGSALVCWPLEFTGFDLFCSSNLNRGDWTLVAGATNRLLAPPPLPAEQYFRLKP